MSDYDYYMVEYSFIVRVLKKYRVMAERLTPEGEWVPYHDLYDITMNGKWLRGGEAEAMATHKELLERNRQWEEEARKREEDERKKGNAT